MQRGEEPVGNILSRRIAAMGLTRQFNAAFICGKAKDVGGGKWDAISFRNGILKLRVSSNEEAYFIKVRSDEIVSQINRAIGKDVVKRLVFKVGE